MNKHWQFFATQHDPRSVVLYFEPYSSVDHGSYPRPAMKSSSAVRFTLVSEHLAASLESIVEPRSRGVAFAILECASQELRRTRILQSPQPNKTVETNSRGLSAARVRSGKSLAGCRSPGIVRPCIPRHRKHAVIIMFHDDHH